MHSLCSYCYTYNEYVFPYSVNKCTKCYKKMYINTEKIVNSKRPNEKESKKFKLYENERKSKYKEYYKNRYHQHLENVNGKYYAEYYNTYK